MKNKFGFVSNWTYPKPPSGVVVDNVMITQKTISQHTLIQIKANWVSLAGSEPWQLQAPLTTADIGELLEQTWNIGASLASFPPPESADLPTNRWAIFTALPDRATAGVPCLERTKHMARITHNKQTLSHSHYLHI